MTLKTCDLHGRFVISFRSVSTSTVSGGRLRPNATSGPWAAVCTRCSAPGRGGCATPQRRSPAMRSAIHGIGGRDGTWGKGRAMGF